MRVIVNAIAGAMILGGIAAVGVNLGYVAIAHGANPDDVFAVFGIAMFGAVCGALFSIAAGK